jgi:pimeloyl-[acyl-carrier protein] methyl ester esterase
MSLHVDRYEYAGTSGSGAPLLLIHGWGMHGGMWSGVAEQLAQNFSVMAVDLPGHGYSINNEKGKGQGAYPQGVSRAVPVAGATTAALGKKGQYLAFPLALEPSPFALDAIVDELSAQFTEPLTVCGWSLGGQIALHWAMRYPQQVSRLVTVASTPSFVRRAGWDHALSAEILQEFADNLQHHYALTLKRFLALQVRGSEQEHELLAMLRGALFSHGEADLSALQGGLEILRDCDLRSALPDIRQPALVIAGERDTLTPPQASQYLASHLPDARLATIRGAAHAPFLSHPDKFMEHILDFLYEPGKRISG